jgi:hypothetical protein
MWHSELKKHENEYEEMFISSQSGWPPNPPHPTIRNAAGSPAGALGRPAGREAAENHIKESLCGFLKPSVNFR